jgi:hypothetical protein
VVESFVPVLTTQLILVAGWPFASVAVNWTWPLVSIVVVEGEMEKVLFDGFALGLPPPQPAITKIRGTVQANSERRCRVIVSSIQNWVNCTLSVC